MRIPFALALLLAVPTAASAQTAEIEAALKTKLAALKYVFALEAPAGGFHATPPKPTDPPSPPPTLRATSAAVRAIKYMGGTVPNPDRHAAFVFKCYDPKTGGFADTPGGKPDVTVTAIGVMAAVELGISKDKFRPAMDYLKANAKTFENVRIGAAAVEAWGVKDCPFDLKPWRKVADEFGALLATDAKDGGARNTGSLIAFVLRLGQDLPPGADPKPILENGQSEDGGWRKKDAKGSDLETTYRVMRAFHLLKEKPKDSAAVRKFVASCRNPDGGFGAAPGEKSSVGGVYFYAIITKWLDEMEKK